MISGKAVTLEAFYVEVTTHTRRNLARISCTGREVEQALKITCTDGLVLQVTQLISLEESR